MTEEEKSARRRERDRARHYRNKERLANDEERKAKMKARRLAREAAAPEHNAKHWGKRKAREAANPEKYAATRARPAERARARPTDSLGFSPRLRLEIGMTLRPRLCVDEGCPRHSIEHVCEEPCDPVFEQVRLHLLRRSKLGMLKYGKRLDRADLGMRDWLQHACKEALDLANYSTCAMREFNGQKAGRAKPWVVSAEVVDFPV